MQTALHAGIDVRMITGDHAVTARAIGDDLGLGPGVITGPEFQKLDRWRNSSSGCPTCTSSAGWRRRTSSAWSR